MKRQSLVWLITFALALTTVALAQGGGAADAAAGQPARRPARAVSGPSADQVVRQYLEAWAKKDFDTMYSLTTKEGQRQIAKEEFVRLLSQPYERVSDPELLAMSNLAKGIRLVAVYPPKIEGQIAAVPFTVEQLLPDGADEGFSVPTPTMPPSMRGMPSRLPSPTIGFSVPTPTMPPSMQRLQRATAYAVVEDNQWRLPMYFDEQEKTWHLPPTAQPFGAPGAGGVMGPDRGGIPPGGGGLGGGGMGGLGGGMGMGGEEPLSKIIYIRHVDVTQIAALLGMGGQPRTGGGMMPGMGFGGGGLGGYGGGMMPGMGGYGGYGSYGYGGYGGGGGTPGAGSAETASKPGTPRGGRSGTGGATGAVQPPKSAPAPGQVRKVEVRPSSEGKVSVDFQNALITEVINALTKARPDMNVIVKSDVVGTVTLTLTNVFWDEALRLAAEQVGAGMYRVGQNIYEIRTFRGPMTRGAAEPAVSPSQQTTPAPFAIGSLTLPNGIASIVALPAQNALLVQGTAEGIHRLEEIISLIDLPTPQITLEVTLLEMKPEDMKELLPPGEHTIALTPQQLRAALQRLGKKAEVIAQPRFNVLSAHPAEISVGPIMMKDSRPVGGYRLRVTPHARRDDAIVLSAAVELFEPVGPTALTTTLTVPGGSSAILSGVPERDDKVLTVILTPRIITPLHSPEPPTLVVPPAGGKRGETPKK